MTPAHDDVRRLIDVIHYEDHPARTESAEFRKIKHDLHAAHAKCWIDNGYCAGEIQIHHQWIEWSASTEVDWARVQLDHPGFDHVDSALQMLPLCHKHHMGVGTGIHMVTYPAWQLQRYLTPAALKLFEAAVSQLIADGHDEHHVNHAAHKMLMHVASVTPKG